MDEMEVLEEEPATEEEEEDDDDGERPPKLMVQCVLFVNITFLATGVGEAVVGMWSQDKFYNASPTFGDSSHNLADSLMVFVGYMVVTTTLVGFWATYHAQKVLISTYAYTIAFAMILETLSGALAIAALEEYKMSMTQRGTDNLKNLYGSSKGKLITFSIDYMQRQFSCCGILNYTQWIGSYWWQSMGDINSSSVVPLSCCKPMDEFLAENSTCNSGPPPRESLYNVSLIYENSCLDATYKEMDIVIDVMSKAAFVSGFIHINGYIFVNYLMSRMV